MTTFEIPTIEQAKGTLRYRLETKQAEFYENTVEALRRLMPVTDDLERAESRSFTLASSFPCLGCGKFSFPIRDIFCFWCRGGR